MAHAGNADLFEDAAQYIMESELQKEMRLLRAPQKLQDLIRYKDKQLLEPLDIAFNSIRAQVREGILSGRIKFPDTLPLDFEYYINELDPPQAYVPEPVNKNQLRKNFKVPVPRPKRQPPRQEFIHLAPPDKIDDPKTKQELIKDPDTVALLDAHRNFD